MTPSLERVVEGLHEIGAVQFGEFRLKSGLMSPLYIDLRLVPSDPRLLRLVGEELGKVAATLSYDRVAAIPYGGLPLGVALSLAVEKPLIYPRKEVKEHGTRRAIEGTFYEGETALVVDDLVSTGGAKLEAIVPLVEAGLVVRDVLVLIDREQGGGEALVRAGYRLHSLFTAADALDVLEARGRVPADQARRVREYLRGQ
ncbi:MAG: orotate phosphoribosyltransferase [Anaerolineae bacterium]